MEKQEMSCSESKDREINDVYQFEQNEKYDFDNFKTPCLEELCTEDGVNAPDTTDYVEDGANAPEIPYVEDGEAASDFPFQEDGASPEIDVICEPNVAILEDGACVPESIIEDGRKTENKTDSEEETNVENLSFAVENLPRQPSSASIEEDGMSPRSAFFHNSKLYLPSENCVANLLAVPMGNDMPGPVADGRVSSPPETHKPCDCTTSCSCGEENECIDTQSQHVSKHNISENNLVECAKLGHQLFHSATAQELWSSNPSANTSDFLQDAVDESQSCVESQIQLCPGTFFKVPSLDANESGTDKTDIIGPIADITFQQVTDIPVAESHPMKSCSTSLCTGAYMMQENDVVYEVVTQPNIQNHLSFLGTGHFVKYAEGAPLMLNTRGESQRRARVDLPQVLDSFPEELRTIEEINSLSSAKSHYVNACKPFITETEVVPSELCGFEAPKSIGRHAETIDNKSELVLPLLFVARPSKCYIIGATLIEHETSSISVEEISEIHSISTQLHTGDVPISNNAPLLSSLTTCKYFVAKTEEVQSELCGYEALNNFGVFSEYEGGTHEFLLSYPNFEQVPVTESHPNNNPQVCV